MMKSKKLKFIRKMLFKIPKNLSSEIAKKYDVINNTFLYKNVGDIYNKFETEIGDIKQTDFYPQVKIKRWDNEANFSVRLKDDNEEAPQIITDKEKIKYQKTNLEAHFYHKTPDENPKDGGYEFEVLLKEKPISNILEFTVQTKGLKFYYQPPLTEEIKVGDENGRIVKVTETDAYVKDEKTGELISIAHRPENVVGSYAVYHESKSGDYSKIGGKNYKAGKAFHIYRPKIIDANGNWTWGKLNIDEKKGILTIEIAQDWLYKAVYPVIVDPTFGYDTVGGTEISAATNYIYGVAASLPENAVVDSISFYTKGSEAGLGVNTGIYNDNSIYPNSLQCQGTANDNIPTTAQWLEFNQSVTLTTGSYWLAYTTENSKVYYYYDLGADNFRGTNTEADYSTLPSIFPENTAMTHRKTSIYCTYTPVPSVTTNAVSSIKDTEATGNGNITTINDTNIIERGFVWDTSSKSYPGNVAPTSSGYANYINETGTFSTGTFSLTLSSLTEGTTYYIRAYAKNNDGYYGYGDEVIFTAGEIKRIDITNEDFDAGIYSSTAVYNNNLRLERNVTLQDTESFETDFGDWLNAAGNDEDWTRKSGYTPSAGTGPSSAYDGDYYIYVETSSGHAYYSGDTSIIEYNLGGTYDGYVDFYYHQYGTNQGALYLEKYDGSSWTTIWSSIGRQGKEWNHVTMSDNDFANATKLRFRNVAAGGYRGDVALDLIKVYAGSGYKTSGTYESATLDISNLYSADDSEISWNATLNGQSLTVKTRYSTDGGSNWSSWQECTNGGQIPGINSIGTNTSNALVQYKVEMSGDSSTTPELSDITLRVIYAGGSTNVTTTPSAQSLIVSQPAITIIAGQNVTVNTNTQDLQLAADPPTIDITPPTTNVTVTLDENSLTITAPLVSTDVEQAVTISAAAQMITIINNTVVVNTGRTIAAETQAITITQPTVTVATSGSVTITPDILSLNVNQPIISINNSSSISASAQSVAVNLNNITVNTGHSVNIMSAVQNLTVAQATITIAVAKNIIIDTEILNLNVSQPTISVSSTANALTASQSITINLNAVTVSTSYNVNITPAALDLTVSNPLISTDVEQNISYAANAQTVTVNILTPTVTARTPVTIAAAALDLTVSQLALSVSTIAQVNYEAEALSVTVDMPDITITITEPEFILEYVKPKVIEVKSTKPQIQYLDNIKPKILK